MNINHSLTHLAIIPDGNRRWAKAHGISSEKKIYEHGVQKVMEIVEAAFTAEVPFVTLWASSLANLLARPKGFVSALEDMYVTMFRQLATHPTIHTHKVRIEAPGEWRDVLRPNTVAAIQEALDATTHYNSRTLTILLGYDGRRERGAALLHLLSDPPATTPIDAKSADDLLRAVSWTGFLPDVDLLIRTGAWQDPHFSAGFLSLIMSEAQLAFPPVLWPDLTVGMLHDILRDFATRERRLGT